ncbi:M56 family metallopeptidase [bacterium]|nr:M56 family metallopeptidase [bacterium]
MNALLDYVNANALNMLNLWLTMQFQTGLFIVVIFLLDLGLRNAGPKVRYLLWISALVKSVIPPIYFDLFSGKAPVTGFFALPAAVVSAVAPGTVERISAPTIIVAALFLAFIVFTVFVLQRSWKLRRRLMNADPLLHDAWDEGPRVYVSSRIPTPLAIGILRPRIYVTQEIATASREVLHAVLHHEHAHIRRRDGVLVLLQTLVQMFYLLNPLVWLMNIRLFRYREQICDEQALERTGTRAVDYGRLLLRFAEAEPARIVQTGTCFFETRRGFAARISHLFKSREEKNMKRLHRVAVGACILLILPLSWQCSEETVSYREINKVSYEDKQAIDESGDSLSLRLGDPLSSTATYKKEGKWKTGAGAKIVGGLKALSSHVIYPEEALKQNLEGAVVVQAKIVRDGKPVYAEVIASAHPLLDEAAKKAVMETDFKVAHRNGKPIESMIAVPIRFRLNTKPPDDK